MSHEDVLFMSHMIQAVAESCDLIAVTIATCTAIRLISDFLTRRR